MQARIKKTQFNLFEKPAGVDYHSFSMEADKVKFKLLYACTKNSTLVDRSGAIKANNKLIDRETTQYTHLFSHIEGTRMYLCTRGYVLVCWNAETSF